jgi:hypothetical protein
MIRDCMLALLVEHGGNPQTIRTVRDRCTVSENMPRMIGDLSLILWDYIKKRLLGGQWVQGKPWRRGGRQNDEYSA